MSDEFSPASTIGGINLLPEQTKRDIYIKLLPQQIFTLFNLPPDLIDQNGNDLLRLQCEPGSTVAEAALYHKHDFPDPIIYGQISDTINGQLHILMYVINDPNSPRFNVDRTSDGRFTHLGAVIRNIEEEIKSMNAGLAPGQVRSGLRLASAALSAFEKFVMWLGHDRFFAEPLYYHNALILEKAGFTYLKGRRLMERINAGFSQGGEFLPALDGTNVFRSPNAINSVRLRSWAIHDGIMGEKYTNVTMYKVVGRDAEVRTVANLPW